MHRRLSPSIKMAQADKARTIALTIYQKSTEPAKLNTATHIPNEMNDLRINNQPEG
jgi:hypothetical protein